MISRISIIAIVVLAFCSCTKDKLSGNIQTDAAFADSLRSSPVAVQVENDSLFLKAYLWRDFMPGTGKNGSGLYCTNQLTFKDSLPIPAGLKLKSQYVINGDQIWINQHPEITKDTPATINGFINSGPKWGPGIVVDVVCEFELNNKIYRLIAKQQQIIATY